MIIDVRANSGGSMLGSSSIADEFLDEGLLISTAGRHGKSVSGLTEEVVAKAGSPFREAPVVILTSPRTASGSELMAASLRNHGRAIFIGQKSFGKGTVQKTYSLGAEDALKLTVGNFLPMGLAHPRRRSGSRRRDTLVLLERSRPTHPAAARPDERAAVLAEEPALGDARARAKSDRAVVRA